jgi:Ca-activated chloride channel family protein
MLVTKYDFAQRILPIGSSGPTDVLLRFAMPASNKPRRKLNLSLVIDRSGSMAGIALSHAIKAAQAVIDALEPTDTISVVAFDDHVSTVIAPQLATDPKAMREKVRGIRAGGTTNLSGGWLEGCKHVKSNYDPQAINRVLLLTDGHANEGITDRKVLTKTATQKFEEGIVTTTLGFGSGFEEDLLIGMARAASGNFYFIQNTDEAVQVFSIELETMKSVLAQNLVVKLELQNGVKLHDTLSLAPAQVQGTTVSLSLGDVFDGEDKLLGLTLDLPELQKAGPLEVVKATYSADAIEDDAIKSISGELVVQVEAGSIEDAAAAAPTGVRVDLARLKIAKAKDVALAQTDQNKYADAEKTLRNTMQEIRNQGLNEHFEIAEELEQLEYFASKVGNKNVSGNTRKELRDQAFQGLNRNRADLAGRGVETSDEIRALPVANDPSAGVELYCVREGGKLKIKVADPRFDANLNVQFPRAIRAEGARYVVQNLETSSDGSFYRVEGTISRLLRPGETDTLGAPRRSNVVRTGKASSAPATASDLEVTSDITDRVLVQCVKEGSKLRARVVSDGFEPTWNMRFPRSIREDGMLYAVDEVITAPDGKSYIACGKIWRFEQT